MYGFADPRIHCSVVVPPRTGRTGAPLGAGDGHNAGDFTADTLDSLSEVRERVPQNLYRQIADVANDPGAESPDT